MVASGVEIYPFHIQERGKALTTSERPCQVKEELDSRCFGVFKRGFAPLYKIFAFPLIRGRG